jgi:bacillithiol system protein YtxJ
MNWISLNEPTQLKQIKLQSFDQPQVIFKHSTRCAISSMAKSRLERNQFPKDVPFYFLDLIKHRNISDSIENEFNVDHESPQVLVIKNGECVYDESHSGINMDEILSQASKT